MSELILTRGLPGSGKSTWAHDWVDCDRENRVRVNRDDIRHMLFGAYRGVDEGAVTSVETATVKAALSAGKDVVVDAMHLKVSYIKKWARIHRVAIQTFHTPIEECVLRDAVRERKVGEKVIRSIAARYRIPSNGLISPVDISDVQESAVAPYVPGPIPAFSFDIDGTLAHMNGRNPFDTSKAGEDTPDPSISKMLYMLEEGLGRFHIGETAIIAVSGRDEKYREITERWLAEVVGVTMDALFMRANGDSRNDAVIKSEIFDKHISGVYDVIAHFDDRNRVVNALRAKGVKVLQVADGDF